MKGRKIVIIIANWNSGYSELSEEKETKFNNII